ncbi:olfactory receptor 6M1-like [Protobothrops mucrosquamatus]|uniref:olfactory receptor 6M1-like n=1 Tax=Protobothrops mucrosquamatus TaxID=103944 RepID=UPI0007756938|nr:olfactory receptor 6M1-like [Protobothrops mucrosquamatus]
MRSQNYSTVKEFIFIGFPGIQKFRVPVFLIIAVFYILILSGNVLIIFFVWKDYRLHTPMYWLLANLSLSGLGFTTVIIPQMMFNIITKRKVISFMGCMIQIYFYFFLGTLDYILVAIMAFDRYVAICNPLRYSVIMSGWFTFQLAAASWIGALFSVLFSAIPFYLTPFCGPNVINHFYCDILPVLRLACKDTTTLKRLSYVSTALIVLCSLFLTSVSYIYIIATILRIPSSAGRHKAFSTCVSHITLALVFYGCSIFMYLLPEKIHSSGFYKGVALLHTVVTPLLNPFIYTLRNEKVKEVFKDALKRMDILAPQKK